MGDPAHGPPPCPVPSSVYLPRRFSSTEKPGSNHFSEADVMAVTGKELKGKGSIMSENGGR